MTTETDQILTRTTDTESEELTLLSAAEDTTRAAYRDSGYAADKKKDWDAAREGLSACLDRLRDKYFAPAHPPFKNRIKVLEWLQGKGYKIQRQKVYDDCNKGVLSVQVDKTILHADVLAYTADLKRVADDAGKPDELYTKKTNAEIESIEQKVEKQRRELDRDAGKWLLRSDVETEAAIKAVAVKAGINHVMATVMGEVVHLVGGEPKKTQAGIEFLTGRLDDVFDEYARLDVLEIAEV